MGRELGRISGPLLADNLRRNGADLQFDNSLLYLNATGNYVGINSLGPSSDLTIGTLQNNGGTGTSSLRTVNLVGANGLNVGNFTISGNTIQQLTDVINIRPNASGTTKTPGLSTSNLYLSGNIYTTTVANDSLNFSPNGTGQVQFANDAGSVQVTVNANLHATGNITWDGNITFGTNNSERITIPAEVSSDIIPVPSTGSLVTPTTQQLTTQDGQVLVTQTGIALYSNPGAPYYPNTYSYDLGSSSLTWATVYSNIATATVGLSPTGLVTATKLNGGNIGISGNTIANNYPADPVYLTPNGTGFVSFNGRNVFSGSNINMLNALMPAGLLPIAQTSKLFAGIDDEALAYVTSNASYLNINNTGTGYVKFAGTNGFVTPVGTTFQRPVVPQQGQMRFNTNIGAEEIYDASAGGWIPIYGPSSNTATINDVNNDSILYSIIFGR
jgi:hypothetical protein